MVENKLADGRADAPKTTRGKEGSGVEKGAGAKVRRHGRGWRQARVAEVEAPGSRAGDLD